VGVPFTFPDTSNNRFQSYRDAAAALILYGDEFKDFFESLCINKQKPTLNHMESNLWKALHCTSTITELAVLAIYAKTILYPYCTITTNSSSIWYFFVTEMAEKFSFDLRRIKKNT
jgi:hypothetical protein